MFMYVSTLHFTFVCNILRPWTKIEYRIDRLHFRHVNFMTLLVVTLVMNYHGVLFQMLDASGPTQSAVGIYGHVSNTST